MKISIKNGINKVFKFIKIQCNSFINACENSIELWEIPIICVTALCLIFAFIAGMNIGLGFNRVIDGSILMIIGVLIILLVTGISHIVVSIISSLPRYFTSFLVASLIIFTVVINESLGLSYGHSFFITSIVVLVEILLGISLFLIFKNNKKVIGSLILVITIFLNSLGGYFFFSQGWDSEEINIVQSKSKIKSLSIEDPSKQGVYEVNKLTYGSGTDKRREEYGEQVDIITRTVNARFLIGEIKGFNGKMRNKFWGFNERNFPLNARVWYPNAKGKFPLVLIVHGNHTMQFWSDTGYDYLGEMLASQGFIAVSVDENFLNGSWTGGIGGENDARGWMLLEHIRQWNSWNNDVDSVFYNKVDMNNIALVGHSRGGEAVSIAAAFNKLKYYPNDADHNFNYNYNIKSVIAIAPTDGQYKPGGKYTPLENVNYLVIQGSNDGDVSSFYGSRQYNRVDFSDDKYFFKTSLYIAGANHGQFNESWGRRDLSFPDGYILNVKPLIEAKDQIKIAKTYIAAFLKTTLQGRDEYLPIFKNYEYALNWLPKTVYMNRFSDSNYSTICNFEEDIDISTGTFEGSALVGENLSFWRERELKLRDNSNTHNSAAYIRWYNSKQLEDNYGTDSLYKIVFSNQNKEYIEMQDKTHLVFSIADTGKYTVVDKKVDNLDLSIRILDKNNESAEIPISNYGTLQNAIKVKFSKLEWYEKKYKNEIEPNLQTFLIPIEDFKNINNKFDMNNIKSISFVFNRVPYGEIIIDDVGII